MNIKKLVEFIEKLASEDQKTIYEAIYPMIRKSSDNVSDYIQDIREQRFASKPHCPYCGSPHIIGHGKYRGRQRYKCKGCDKTYNDLSCSPLAGTHYPDKWAKHIVLLLEKAVLKRVAEELDIHISTAYYWRHKALTALCALNMDEMHGIIESDEKFFLESNKGKNQVKRYGLRKPRKRGGKAKKRGISDEQVCVIVAMDRAGAIISKTAGRGRITDKEIETSIGSYIPDDAILCTDAATNFSAFAKGRKITHKATNANKKRRVVEKIYHIQHVNSYHSRMENLINRYFRGVSTKHLDKYLAWQRFLELNKNVDKVALKKNLLTAVFKADSYTPVAALRPT